jgi:hypothetical protein
VLIARGRSCRGVVRAAVRTIAAMTRSKQRHLALVLLAVLAGAATSCVDPPAQPEDDPAEPPEASAADLGARSARACAPDGTVVSSGNACPGAFHAEHGLALCCSRLAAVDCPGPGDAGTVTCIAAP